MSTIEHILPPDELMAYLDGELTPERAATIRTHLSECAVCQALAADVHRTSTALREWDVPAPPDSLRAPAMRVRDWRRLRTRFASWPAAVRHVAAAALCIVAAGAVIWVFELEPPFALSAPAARSESRDVVSIAVDRQPGAGGSARVTPRTATSAPAASRAEAQPPAAAPASSGPQIVRTVSLTMVTRDVASVRPALEGLLRELGGFFGSMQASEEGDVATLRATLRVPAGRLEAAVTTLRQLGRVIDETRTGEDVSERVRDIEARLTNSRNTEKRLTEVLRTRTGDVADVLEVEREIARVREEIERMDAERNDLERRVAYATITLNVSQERQATLDIGPLPLSARFHNAAVDGLRRAFASIVEVTLSVLHIAPVVLLWTVVLWWPIRVVVRRGRASLEKPA